MRYNNENDDAAYDADQQNDVSVPELDSSIIPLRSPHLDSPSPDRGVNVSSSLTLAENRRSRIRGLNLDV